MSEPLTTWVARFVENRDAFADSLGVPVLLYEPTNEPPRKSQSTYQLHAISKSGREVPILGSFATVSPLVKQEGAKKDDRVTVGRTEDNDLRIEHASVSRLHAWFSYSAKFKKWQLTDAGSRNGTVVDGERISARKAVGLGAEATIGFGDVNVRFFLPPALVAFLQTQVDEGPGSSR